jgi:1-aminocyclopropane-1-carboxylate deaminase/D-cysteine desulfhydrase-like pyridoxal-dependent ACC family enzyme
VEELSRAGVELFIKNDGGLSTEYGGNKARKLERILGRAIERGARRIVTIGPAGSHHVLATTWFASRVGLPTAGLLLRQPSSAHAEMNLRVALGAGLEPIPVPSPALLPWVLARVLRPGDWVVPPGGASPEGVLAFSEAIDELEQQLVTASLPPPDVIVVAVGTGGTAAGLLAGLRRRRLPTALVGADVGVLGRRARLVIERLSRLGQTSEARPGATPEFQLDRRHTGEGYGKPGLGTGLAKELAQSIGLSLDPSYTEKAFATALSVAGDHAANAQSAAPAFASGLRVLYWHTLSETLPPARPTSDPLPPGLSALLETTHTSPSATK